YLRAITDQLERDRDYPLDSLPPTIEGFFKQSLGGVREDNPVLGKILGILAVARNPLSLAALSAISGMTLPDTREQGVRPIRQFLTEIDDSFTFLHAKFHEFVTQTILFDEEVRQAHGRMADWLVGDKSSKKDRLESLAYHLFESGRFKELINVIDEA